MAKGQMSIEADSKELLKRAPKSLERAPVALTIGVGSKELLEWAPKSRWIKVKLTNSLVKSRSFIVGSMREIIHCT